MQTLRLVSNLDHLEMELSLAATRKQQEVFGDEEIEVQEGEPLYGEIDEYLTDLVKDYPTDRNGSRFINSYCMICPKLVVRRISIPDETEFKTTFGPLVHAIFGKFTHDDAVLKIRNIRPVQKDAFSSNFPTLATGKTIAINKFYISERSTSSTTTKVKADIKFGKLLKQANQEIQLETSREGISEYKISLPHFIGKIAHDGTVSLENGMKFAISQLIGPKKVRWINFQFPVELPFTS